MALQRFPISTGWSFKNATGSDDKFLPVSQFPTTIHQDLLHHGKIVDPFLDSNETQVQWIGEEAWTYRTTFPKPKAELKNMNFELVFEGLDTYCTILLNSKEIKRTDNMYLEHRIDIGNLIEEVNQLELRFQSTFLVGRRMEKEAKLKPLFCHNGDQSRLQVRKAPYSYGWDWGPTILTCGPWRPIYLEISSTKIEDLWFYVELSDSLSDATITTYAQIHPVASLQKVEFELVGPDGLPIQSQTVDSKESSAGNLFHLKWPQLWYPAGNGPQPLYTLKANVLTTAGIVSCTLSKRFGIRRIELIQRPLEEQPGATFFFQVNNVPVFGRGSNWIPADILLPRVTTEKYRKLVRLAVEGNQNMIRVWGGGIYEDDAFYDACDEFGVLVWQDFMLACGSYPITPEFRGTFEAEAIYNIKRLRHHPSIVLWCGNNEDHMFADAYSNGGYNPTDLDPENWLKSNWPARIIYDKILAEMCAKLVPNTPYHPGSPWGGRPSNDPTVGDTHAWDVWMKASKQYPYQRYPELAGRFVSEFGLKSYPTLRTIMEFITDPSERYPQSKTMDAHQKSSSKSTWARDNRTIALYIVENFKHGYKMSQYAYTSMLVQSEAMYCAFSGWRRLWKGPGKEECAGAIVWQLNDAWPCVSWSLIDFNLRPKYAYYAVKRAIAPLVVGVARVDVETSRDDEFTHVHIHKEKRLQVWASNFGVDEVSTKLFIQGIDVPSGKTTWERRLHVLVLPNQSTELFDERLEFPAEKTIFLARLIKEDKVIARFAEWPQPLRHLDLPKPSVNVRVEGDHIHVSSLLPAKGVVFDVEDDEVIFDDNCTDVIPGDDQVVLARGLKGRSVTLMHLGMAAD
ncbi:glycoside hydrolase family 2 protein [Hyaloscypha variabilis F]|uniref:Beta-mannosidase B n=1 Tax=Hyaloscypha variabilis (strain UAMH 11265 / GT02V1 / F) TaxID=1149755 RepID=A0A2J6SBL7_HYAVF|nr:glycoside hydrolase family 2 protein [Hyaloscypha variabilis F]